MRRITREFRLYLSLVFLLIVLLEFTTVAVGLVSAKTIWWSWIVGLLYAVFVGQFVTHTFLCVLRDWYMNISKPTRIRGVNSHPVPAGLMGTLERLVFFVAVGLKTKPEVVLPTMAGWLAMKMLANWNRGLYTTSDMTKHEAQAMFTDRARGALAALLAGVVSLGIGATGGAIASRALTMEKIAGLS